MKSMNKKYIGIGFVFAMLLVLVVLSASMNAPMALAQATNTPTVTNTPTNTPTPTTTPFPVARPGQVGGSILCLNSAVDCLQSRNGGGIHFYGADGSLKYSVDAATGSLFANSITFSTPPVTPQVFVGATPVAARQVCKIINVIGSATVTYVGISTPASMSATFSGDPGANADKLYTTTGSGVFTVFAVKVVSNTPAAATTVVAVDTCGRGN